MGLGYIHVVAPSLPRVEEELPVDTARVVDVEVKPFAEDCQVQLVVYQVDRSFPDVCDQCGK